MQLKLEKDLSVAAPLERVWRALLDAGDLARCVPSGDLRRLDSEEAYAGVVTIGAAPVRATLRPVDADEDERVASFQVEGREAGGSGMGAGMVVGRITEAHGTVRVRLSAELRLAGLRADTEVVEHAGALALEDFARRLEQRMLSDEQREAPAAAAAPPRDAGRAAASSSAAPRPAPRRAEIAGAAPATAAAGLALLAVVALRRRRRSISVVIRLHG